MATLLLLELTGDGDRSPVNRMEKFWVRHASAKSGDERPAVTGTSVKLSVATVLDLSVMNLRRGGRIRQDAYQTRPHCGGICCRTSTTLIASSETSALRVNHGKCPRCQTADTPLH